MNLSQPAGVLQTRQNIRSRQGGIGGNNLIHRIARTQTAENRFNGDSRSANYGTTVANGRVDFDSIHDLKATTCLAARKR